MAQQPDQSVIKQTKNNFFISYQLLKENWVPFSKTELFAVLSLFLLVISIFGFSEILRMNNIKIFNTTRSIQLLFYFIVIILLNLIFLTFLTSQFGLANDIFSSGHMYAEFSSSFTYYRKHWKIYTVLTLIIFFNQFLADPFSILPIAALFNKIKLIPIELSSVSAYITDVDFTLYLLRQFFLALSQLFSIMILVGILPGISSNKDLQTAIRENFSNLKENFALIFLNWTIYFLIFIFPLFLFNATLLFFFKYNFTNQGAVILGIIHLIINITFTFASMPFLSLLATRLYVSINNLSENSKTDLD